MNLPNDPIMLMSYLNTQLRDNYPSLEELCKSMCLDETEIRAKLETVGSVSYTHLTLPTILLV